MCYTIPQRVNACAPPIRSSTKDSRTNFIPSSILPSYVEAEAVDFSRFRFHRKSTASTSLVKITIKFLFKRISLVYLQYEKVKTVLLLILSCA